MLLFPLSVKESRDEDFMCPGTVQPKEFCVSGRHKSNVLPGFQRSYVERVTTKLFTT